MRCCFLLFHTSITTLYLNLSLWLWLIFLILTSASCGLGNALHYILHFLDCPLTDVGQPLMVAGLVLVAVFALLSLLDCFLGQDGWYLVDLKQAGDAGHYFGQFSPISVPSILYTFSVLFR